MLRGGINKCIIFMDRHTKSTIGSLNEKNGECQTMAVVCQTGPYADKMSSGEINESLKNHRRRNQLRIYPEPRKWTSSTPGKRCISLI